MELEEFEELFGNIPINDLKKIKEYINKNFVSKDIIRGKIKEYSNIKGDFATYIAVSERIKGLQELLK